MNAQKWRDADGRATDSAGSSAWHGRLARRRGGVHGPLALAAAAVLFFFIALAGCKARQTAYQAGDKVAGYAKDVSDAAGRLTTKAGERLGLVEKKFDYVRLAWAPGEPPAALRAEYSQAEEREAGRALGAELAGRYGLHADEGLQRYVSLVAAGVAAYSDRPELPVAAGVLRTEEPRCFALPGGLLLVSLGALRVCESESELAGLLAGGIAQVRLRQTMALLERLHVNLRPEAPAGPVTGAGDDFAAVADAGAQRLIQDACTADEWAACDREATAVLLRAGYEPGGLKAYLARLQVHLRAKDPDRPLEGRALFLAREQAIEARLAALHAPAAGRALGDRYRQECAARLPARLAP